MLEVKNLTVRVNGAAILNDVSFTLRENQWLMVVGPNGAGKSTLINAVSQGLAYTGQVLYRGQDARRMKPARLAQAIGVLAQTRHVAYPFSVGEVVRLGRYSYAPGPFSAGGSGGRDEDDVRRALALTGLTERENQSVLTLSGGELQRAFLAQVFAQDPQVLLLDEPTNHLDLVYQKQVFGLIAQWLRQPGRAVLSVVHDLALARCHGTEILLLHEGRAAALGPAQEVLSRPRLQEIYQMDVHGWMRQMLRLWE